MSRCRTRSSGSSMPLASEQTDGQTRVVRALRDRVGPGRFQGDWRICSNRGSLRSQS